MDEATFINLLQNQKEDLIRILGTHIQGVEERVESVHETVKKQNSRIGKLEDRVAPLEKTSLERGYTCKAAIDELQPTLKTVKVINFLANHKFISITLGLILLVGIQGLVVYLLGRVEISRLLELLYK